MIVHEYCFIVYFHSPISASPSQTYRCFCNQDREKGKPTLRVTWNALQNISVYRVEYRRNGELNWGNRMNRPPYTTSTLLPALLPGTEYNVRMRAVSAAGEGEWSEVLTETTFDSEFVCTFNCVIM